MKKTLVTRTRGDYTFNLLDLPESNFFKFEIINKYGSHIERAYNKKYNKNVYGISHFIEHLGFRAPKDYTTEELLSLVKTEGTYNASTDYDRINYWFQTSMENMDLAIRLVSNYTLNTLEGISEEEFLIERKVVHNEAKRYADDDQTMFWFNVTGALSGYDEEDNVISTPDIIDTYTIEDCIAIKKTFINNGKNNYNVTYDSTKISEKELITKLVTELDRFIIDDEVCITDDEYLECITWPQNIEAELKNESEQKITYINLDIIDSPSTADAANAYLSMYAKDTSLNDLIREKNGLTYGVHLGTTITAYNHYTYFGCDVSAGDEELLMKLFKESINLSVDGWNTEVYNKYMKTRRLKRDMALLNLKVYDEWLQKKVWDIENISALEPILCKDLRRAYEVLDDTYITEELMKEYMVRFKDAVNAGDYGIVVNV